LSSVRLESYLFTLESFRDARALFVEGGTCVMYNQYRWDWLVNRLATMLETVFECPPRQLQHGNTTILAVGERIEGERASREGFVGLATDDWPHVYMREPGIHWLYLGMIAMFLIASLIGVRFLSPGTLSRPHGPFFMMGAAFLLLETKSITFFSLLFGTTWFVNSLAFAGILVSVLAANLVVHRFDIRQRVPLFMLLFAGLALGYLVPSTSLLSIESLAVRYIAGISLVFSPIFFANLIFSREFRDEEKSTDAFGWNILGAVMGGGLEYLSLYIGQRNLLFIVGACYLLCALLLFRRLKLRSTT